MLLRAFVLLLTVSGHSLAAAPPLLPKGFGGWQKVSTISGRSAANLRYSPRSALCALCPSVMALNTMVSTQQAAMVPNAAPQPQ